MEIQDYYESNGVWGDGLLNGMGVSVLAHAAVVMLMLTLSWLVPSRGPNLALCTVSLLSVQDLGGGSGEGAEGAMRKGDGIPAPTEGPESTPVPPPTEAMTEPEPDPERFDVLPLAAVPKPVEKLKEKPKPKTPPRSPRVPQTIARVESRPPSASSMENETVGVTDRSGEGSGRGEADGTGKGHAGDGPGAGSGVGAGAGRGPIDASFGSGDGPRFATRILPKYPRLAREMGKEGTVLLRVTIDERGHLVEVQVLKAAGSGFDEEAVRAVRESSYCPARRNGTPVLCRAHLPVLFVLTAAESN